MNFLSRFLLRRKIKKVISKSYDYIVAETMLDTIQIFKALDKPTLIKVWGYRFPPYNAECESLDALIKLTGQSELICGQLTETSVTLKLRDPLEWLTGAKRQRILPLLNDTRLPELGEMAAIVWHSHVNSHFDVLSVDQTNTLLAIIRRVLKGVDKCL